MCNPFSLQDKTILITGASSGIGKATAIECSRMGARLVITGRNPERLGNTLSEMVGTDHIAVTADITLNEQRKTLCEQVPQLDGIVHCAGINRRLPCKNIHDEDIRNVMAINFEAPILLQALLLSTRKIKREASVVFIASKAADFPAVGNAIYSASKGALISYAKVLALELAPRQIRVNCICPAMVWTDMSNGGTTLTQEELERSQQKYPLKRYGHPAEIAYLAVYLLSDASVWMTGSRLEITGGAKEL